MYKHLFLRVLLIFLKDDRPELERLLDDKAHDQTLLPLISVIGELMRFLPSSRITASGALEFLRRNACVTNLNMKQLDTDKSNTGDKPDIEDKDLEQSILTPSTSECSD